MGRALVTVTAVRASVAAGSAAAGATELMIGIRPTSVVAFDGTVTIFGCVAGAAQQRRTSGAWVRVRTMTIRDAFGNGGLASGVARVASGLVIRAVFPRSQAAPCFLPALGNRVRT